MPEVDRFKSTHDVLVVQDAFSHLRFNGFWSWLKLKPVEIVMHPKAAILKRKDPDD